MILKTNTLYHGDCLDWMEKWDDFYVNLGNYIQKSQFPCVAGLTISRLSWSSRAALLPAQAAQVLPEYLRLREARLSWDGNS